MMSSTEQGFSYRIIINSTMVFDILFSHWSKMFFFSLYVQSFIVVCLSDIMKVQYDADQCSDNSGHYFLKRLPPVNSNSLDLLVQSNFYCAVMAKTNKAIGYSYEGGNCNLTGLGLGSDCHSIIFGPGELISLPDLEEVSRGKDMYATQDYDHMLFPIEKIVDESTISFYHSINTGDPWLLVDIGQQRIIHEIEILPRQYDDCCFERFNNIEIRAGDSLITNGDLSSYTLMFSYAGPYVGNEGAVVFSSKQGYFGRYLSIQRRTNYGTLEIANIKIFVAV